MMTNLEQLEEMSTNELDTLLLHGCLYNYGLDYISRLLKSGANPNHTCMGHNLLYVAILLDRVHLIDTLIENGAVLYGNSKTFDDMRLIAIAADSMKCYDKLSKYAKDPLNLDNFELIKKKVSGDLICVDIYMSTSDVLKETSLSIYAR